MKVWVLDLVGYDARGGMAEVYSTLEKAKASKPRVEWKQASDTEWIEALPTGSLADMYVINERVVDDDG